MFIKGKSTCIRDFKYADLDDYFEMNADHRISIYEFRSALDFDKAKEELTNKIEVSNIDLKSEAFLGVECIATQKLIGELCLSYIDPEQTVVMIGFAINPAYWRQGYATDMIEAFLDYHFTHGGLRVFCSTFSENLATVQLLTKMGFTKEGQLRKSVWAKDKIWDEAFFGIMSDEWENRASN